MKVWVVVAFALGGAGFGVALLAGAGAVVGVALVAPAGVGCGALAVRRRQTSPHDRRQSVGGGLRAAVPEWQAGRRTALETTVAELAGPAYSAHAQRCAALAAMLAEQLAIPPGETGHLTLAAALHVLPAAFPASEDGEGGEEGACRFAVSSLLAAGAALARVTDPEVARFAGEAAERWDGGGLPHHLLGEEASLGGRVLAAVCAFDHASAAGLEHGLAAVRTAEGAFDPVVVAELVHLFRQPWQQQQAA